VIEKIGQTYMAALCSRQDTDVDDDDNHQTYVKSSNTHSNSILSVIRMARHVRAAPECNAMIQPLVDFCCFRVAMFRPYIVL